MLIGKVQICLINQAKSYLKESINPKIDKSSILLYLISWDPCSTGNHRLKMIFYNWRHWFQYYRSFIKNIFSIRNYTKLSFYENSETNNESFKTLLISWCKVTDFNSDGVYLDRYFNASSTDCKDVLWLLISLDSNIPKIIPRNVKIYSKIKVGLWEGLFFTFKVVIKEIFKNSFRPNLFKHSLSAESVFGRKIADVCSKLNRVYNFSIVLLPYEAQPFQHAVYLKLKEENVNIRTAGYLHSSLPPLPTDLIKREGAPEIVYSHGSAQIEIMIKFLGWKVENLKLIKSLRYRLDSTDSFESWIFLPYSFSNGQLIISAMTEFLQSVEAFSLPKLKLRNHPAKFESKIHLELVDDIENLLRSFGNKFDEFSSRKVSVFIGATAAIVEAIERGIEIIHITANPVFEAHTSEIWNEFDVKALGKNIFRYRLEKKGIYIDLGNDKQPFFEMVT